MCIEPPVQPVLHLAPPELAPIPTAAAPIRVLLVEDNPESADLVRVSLRGDTGAEFDIEWAPSLVEAVIRLSQPGIDVVLLDLGLPELDGYKSYRVIESASGRRLPVVILTADDRRMSRDLTLGFGAADYLLKQDASPARLKRALHHAVLSGPPQFSA